MLEKLMLVTMLGAVGCAQEHQVFVGNNGDGDAGRDDAAQKSDATTTPDVSVPDSAPHAESGIRDDAAVIVAERFDRAENCFLSEQGLHRAAANFGACFDGRYDASHVYDGYSALALGGWRDHTGVLFLPALGDCDVWRALAVSSSCEALHERLDDFQLERQPCDRSIDRKPRCAGDTVEVCKVAGWQYVRRGMLMESDARWQPAGDCDSFGLTCGDEQEYATCVGGAITTDDLDVESNIGCTKDRKRIAMATTGDRYHAADCPSGTVCSAVPYQGEVPVPMCHVPSESEGGYSWGHESCPWPGYGTRVDNEFGGATCIAGEFSSCLFGEPFSVSCSAYDLAQCGERRGCYCEPGDVDC